MCVCLSLCVCVCVRMCLSVCLCASTSELVYVSGCALVCIWPAERCTINRSYSLAKR